MTSLTLHAMDDELFRALRRRAEEGGMSLNQAAKQLLASALGVLGVHRRAEPGFLKFAGSLSAEEADELRAHVDAADFSKVDEDDWK